MYFSSSSSDQLVSFGLSNEMMVTFKDENLMTFRHLFLKGYKDQQLRNYALYTKADVYDHVDYVVNRVLKQQCIISQGEFVAMFYCLMPYVPFFSTFISRT